MAENSCFEWVRSNGISVLAVNYWMNHLGIHFFPLLFFCWMKLVQILSHDNFAISLSAKQRVRSEILGPWNQIREYQSDGFVGWITDGSQPPSSAPVYRICIIIYVSINAGAFCADSTWNCTPTHLILYGKHLFLFFSHVAHSGILLQLAAISPCGKRPCGAQKGTWFIHIFPLGSYFSINYALKKASY